jgi:hypothetical protein
MEAHVSGVAASDGVGMGSECLRRRVKVWAVAFVPWGWADAKVAKGLEGQHELVQERESCEARVVQGGRVDF